MLQVVGVLAPEAHSEATLAVREVPHEAVDAQALAQQLRTDVEEDTETAGTEASGPTAEAGRVAAAPAGAAGEGSQGQPTLMHMGHSVMLVEVWEVVEVEEDHSSAQELREHAARAHTDVTGQVMTSGNSSSNSSGDRPGQGRSLQQEFVTDLPASDPRQCIFPT